MAVAEKHTAFWMNAHERRFGEYSPADERMHREANAENSADMSAVETQYVGFSVPEANIHSLNYTWLHPSLNIASGGAWAWQGIKPTQLHSEIFDMRDFMPIDVVGELDKYSLPNSYSFEAIKPLEEIRISYEDPKRNNAFDITCTAVMPPAMLPGNKHFDQAMRTRGTVTMRGETFTVDGFNVRDRSWGEVRPQEPVQAPPMHWLTAEFDEDFVVHVAGIEDPAQDPLWLGTADFTADQVNGFNRGWIWRSGELIAVASATLTTKWDRMTGYPTAHHVEFVDVNDKRYTMTGEVTAASRWYAWSNAYFPVGLTRWECEGKVGWGDSQTGVWENFARKLNA